MLLQAPWRPPGGAIRPSSSRTHPFRAAGRACFSRLVVGWPLFRPTAMPGILAGFTG